MPYLAMNLSHPLKAMVDLFTLKIMKTTLLTLSFTLLFLNLQAQHIGLKPVSHSFITEPLAFNSNIYSAEIGFSSTALDQALQTADNPHPLVRTGKILTFVGIPLVIIGAIMVSNADALYYECVNGNCEGDPQGGFGTLILASGIGASTTGIILWTIGHNKSK